MELVSVRGLSKWFPDRKGTHLPVSSLWHALLHPDRETAAARKVLSGINLTVKRGESVGLIGENGAGKSTLLKILAGVLAPSRGQIRTRGNMAALLELGAGFHPEFTGMANLRLSAALMGMSTRDIDKKLPDILAFADIGDFINEPIKHYSSGMTVRLGFALATARKPDLLVTDEVLAVGDESFQRKCMRWMDGYMDGGGTLMLVSHGMDQVRRLCERAYWLKDGRIECEGKADDVVDRYLEFHETKDSVSTQPDPGGGLYRIIDMEIDDQQPDELLVRCELHSPDDREPVVAIGIKDRHGTPVYGLTSEMGRIRPRRAARKRYEFELRFETSLLQPGQYRATSHAMDPEGLRLFDTVVRDFSVAGVPPEQDQGFLKLGPAIDDQLP